MRNAPCCELREEPLHEARFRLEKKILRHFVTQNDSGGAFLRKTSGKAFIRMKKGSVHQNDKEGVPECVGDVTQNERGAARDDSRVALFAPFILSGRVLKSVILSERSESKYLLQKKRAAAKQVLPQPFIRIRFAILLRGGSVKELTREAVAEGGVFRPLPVGDGGIGGSGDSRRSAVIISRFAFFALAAVILRGRLRRDVFKAGAVRRVRQ